MNKLNTAADKNTVTLCTEHHSPEVRKRIEQASKKIMERNFNLYRRLENK